MFYEIAREYHSPFTPFAPYPAAADRSAWQSMDEEWKKESIRFGEQYLNFDYPSISAVDFMEFSRTGNRVRYEDKFFSRRLALDALILAECVENKGRFLDDIINGIFFICEESAWQLPPHNTYVRDTPQLLLPDAAAPVLDLFACETGAILATASYLLKDKLNEISPFITKRIFHELQQRIFSPYFNYHFWWMGNGREPMNNWTIWCTQNVLLSVFLTDTEEELKRRVFLKACQSADYFLAEYGDDGCCDEGAQYYRHAGLCLFNTLEILNAVTNNSFSCLYQNPKIQNIAAYILNVHIEDKYYVNFADCSPVAGRAGVREFLFAERTGNNSMAGFAASDFIAGNSETLLLPTENNLYYRLQNGFTVSEIKKFHQDSAKPVTHPDIYYPSVGIFITRDESLCLAVKAGDNGDSHNHNDTGSFTVYKNGLPFFIDIGVESYTQKTFSDRRYEIWTMQSAYHNLPTINGCMQKDGEAYHARVISQFLSDAVSEIEMDIAPAYPAETGLLYYKRKASLKKGSEIIIEDRFAFSDGSDCNNEVILSLMTYEKPVLQENTDFLLFAIGRLGTLRITNAAFLKIETIPITDNRLKAAWEHEVYRILVTAVKDDLRLFIS